MSSTKKIAEAQSTCDGLQRLVRRLNTAAIDLDKSGCGSTYELIALLSTTHTCLSSLSSQLDSLAGEAKTADTDQQTGNVTQLHHTDEYQPIRENDVLDETTETKVNQPRSAHG